VALKRTFLLGLRRGYRVGNGGKERRTGELFIGVCSAGKNVQRLENHPLQRKQSPEYFASGRRFAEI
jgi:hypothetical protein